MGPYGDMFKGITELAIFGAICAVVMSIGGIVGLVAGVWWLYRHVPIQ